MSKSEKKLQDAQQKVGKNIQDFVESFHSVSELYERAAKATACLMHLGSKMCSEQKEIINNMVQDYICILDLLEPFNEKGGEV
jgi:hypothetical protein